MNKKKKIGLIFGGRSTEHEISILSAKNIFNAIDKEKFEIIPIYISKDGKFFYLENIKHFPENLKEIEQLKKHLLYFQVDSSPFVYWEKEKLNHISIDVFFPITHGTFGEDGSLQGLLKLTSIPFVGCDILSSALCMDKEAMKQILTANQIPVTPYVSYLYHEKSQIPYDEIINKFHLPVFIKPARQGSSVGVYRAKTYEEMVKYIELSFQYDTKILIEKEIKGKEIECAVLGNEEPKVTIPGEIKPNHEFYSYEAKYIDPQGAGLLIPAQDLTEEEIEKIKHIAYLTYKALYCEGMARVDMFYANGEIYVNEVNTLPGFTNISMYPKLWEYEGLTQTELINKLIDLAEDKFKQLSNLKYNY
ncbi:MAG: D-alanine--D-alanine ligase [Leptospiraceae bacterium]|nr:MAG: D-alanine--D-alanine ligase [Leptospiraceae bacterium]